ncbi:hypothetical protein J2Y74_002789 [Pseudomonas migulae]|uniref:hypothetical protein n=1 Tax=Pseudomonas migulae TaxID=78543 RepID=UPI00209D4568|nr:hypothetical protein [Pseudomonas migulae]MCP1518479.1 hypothetical protein [Pseudomonas migulae]
MKIEEMLVSKGLSRNIAAMTVDALANDSEHSDFKLILRDLSKQGSYVAIKDDDFPVLETAATIVVGLLGSTVAAWAPGAVTSLIILLFKFRRKGIPLSGNQAAIAVELNRHPQLTVKQLVNGLQLPLAEEDVYAELVALTSIARNDGVKVELVSVDPQGRWTLDGV